MVLMIGVTDEDSFIHCLRLCRYSGEDFARLRNQVAEEMNRSIYGYRLPNAPRSSSRRYRTHRTSFAPAERLVEEVGNV
jgi:hypothetical protein